MYKLYAAVDSCSFCAQVALEELQIPYETIFVSLQTADSPLLAVNPLGKVPTLVTPEELILTQSSVVLPFLADLDPREDLLPRSGKGRLRTLEWLGFMNSDVHVALKMMVGAPRYCADPQGLRSSFQSIASAYFQLIDEAVSEQPWLTGAQMTVADIYAAAAWQWALRAELPVANYTSYQRLSESFEARPAVLRARRIEKEASLNRREVFSTEWFEAVKRILTNHVLQAREAMPQYSIVERYLDVTDSAHQADGFRLAFNGYSVTLEPGASTTDRADLIIDTYRTDAAQAAVTRHGEEYDRLVAQRTTAGRLSMTGSPPPLPIAALLKLVHDEVVEISKVTG